MVRAALLFVLVAACARPPLAPDADLRDDPMIAALPADAALVVRFDLEPDDLARWGEAGLVRPDALPLTGPPERLAGSCGSTGCLALVEGDVAPRDPRILRVDTNAWATSWQAWSAPERPMLWRRLSEDKAVVGDRQAVLDLGRAHAGSEPGLDPDGLHGAVPAGRGWIVARDASAVRRLLLDMGLSPPELPAEAALVRSVAVAWDTDEARVWLTLRAVLVDEQSARLAARAVGSARPYGLAAVVLDRARLVRRGEVVELQGAWVDLDELSAWSTAAAAEVLP